MIKMLAAIAALAMEDARKHRYALLRERGREDSDGRPRLSALEIAICDLKAPASSP